jgi:hypothetical protein
MIAVVVLVAALVPAGASPTRPPSLSITPPSGLHDNQQVIVSGSGLRPNTVYALEHCSTAGTSCQPANNFNIGEVSVATDGAGTFRLFVLTITESLASLSCYPAACAIGAIPSGSSTPTVLQPISFATPTISVSPSSGLSDGAQVTVSGRDFAYNSQTFVFECAPPSTTDCNNPPVGAAPATDGAGAFTVTINVSQTIKGLVFCGSLLCDIDARSVKTPDATATLSFIGSPPPPNNPTISLQPPGPSVLRGNPPLVSGAGYPPGLGVSACEAIVNPQSVSDCLQPPGPASIADSSGSFGPSFGLVLVGQGQTASGKTADCTVAGNCVIATFPGYRSDPPPPAGPYQTTPIVVTG